VLAEELQFGSCRTRYDKYVILVLIGEFMFFSYCRCVVINLFRVTLGDLLNSLLLFDNTPLKLLDQRLEPPDKPLASKYAENTHTHTHTHMQLQKQKSIIVLKTAYHTEVNLLRDLRTLI
jgi:hypothetical protein